MVRPDQSGCKRGSTTSLRSKVCSLVLLYLDHLVQTSAQSRAKSDARSGCSGPAPASFYCLQGWRLHGQSGPLSQCLTILSVGNFSYHLIRIFLAATYASCCSSTDVASKSQPVMRAGNASQIFLLYRGTNVCPICT